MKLKAIEICANSVQSAINASLGGADRIELCQNLNEGGTTPSWAAIKYCVEKLPLKTMVLIRPRPGNFRYNAAEFEAVKADVVACRELGAHGVVIGFLDDELNLDVERTREVVELAGDMEVTFHRAFDCCRDWRKGLEQIIECGCDRVLTSGQCPTALEGVDTLREIVLQAAGRIAILAGSGVKASTAVEIVKRTGVAEIHASCKHAVVDPRDEKLFGGYGETDLEEVRRLCAAIAQA